MKRTHRDRLLIAGLLLALASPFVIAEPTYHPVWTNPEGEPWRNEDGLCWRDPTRTGPPTPACGDPAPDDETATAADGGGGSAADASAGQAEQTREIRSEVLFAFDSAQLTAPGRNAIRAALEAIGPDWRITEVAAIGHTDRIGTAAYNRTLSTARAEAVAGYLRERTELADTPVRASGVGESDPVVQCADDLGRAALIECLAPNRRTELVFSLRVSD